MAQVAEIIEEPELAGRKLLIDWRPTRGEIVTCLLSSAAVLALTIGTARQLLHDASSASEAVKAEVASSDQS